MTVLRKRIALKLDYTGSSGQYYYALADTKENLENIKEWQYDTYDDFFTFLILKEDYSIDEKIVKKYVKWFDYENIPVGVSELTISVVKDAIPVYEPVFYSLLAPEGVNYADYNVLFSNNKCSYDVKTLKQKTNDELSKLSGFKTYTDSIYACINFGIPAPEGAICYEVYQRGSSFGEETTPIEINDKKYYADTARILTYANNKWSIPNRPNDVTIPAVKLRWTVEQNGDRRYVYQHLPTVIVYAITSIPPAYSFKFTGKGNITSIEWDKKPSERAYFIGDETDLKINAKAVIQDEHGNAASQLSTYSIEEGVFNPVLFDNHIIWEGDKKYVRLTFEPDDNGSLPYFPKLSTAWRNSGYAAVFSDQEAYIFDFVSNPYISSSSRPILEIYNPFDKNGEISIREQAVIYQIVDGELIDVTKNFAFTVNKDGDEVFQTKTRQLGTYIFAEHSYTGDPGISSDYDLKWDVKAEGADVAFKQESIDNAILSVIPTNTKGTITVTATFSHPDLFDTVTRTLQYKFTAKQHAERIVPAESIAQAVIDKSGVVSYKIKAEIQPKKAAEKSIKWTAYNYENGQKGPEVRSALSGNTATFRNTGMYLLKGKIDIRQADGLAGEPVAGQIILHVLPASQSVKSLSISQKQVLISGTEAPFPTIYANGKEVVDLKNTIVLYDADKISIDTASNTIKSKTNAGYNEKVQVKYGGRTAVFYVVQYAVNPDVKVQMRLRSNENSIKLFPNGKYEYMFVDAKTNKELSLSASQIVVTPDKKLLSSDNFTLDTENRAFDLRGVASGKLSFTILNDPKKRKGTLSINTLKIAPAGVQIETDDTQNYNGKYLLSDRTITMRAIPSESYADLNIKWSVSNSKIASIKKNGGSAVLTLKKPGDIYVYAANTKKNEHGNYASVVIAIQVADITPKIGGNTKSIVVNTESADLGTIVPLTRCEYFSADNRSAQIVQSIKGAYTPAQGFGARWNYNTLYVAANRNAKSGKYFVALHGWVENKKATVYLPLTIKVASKQLEVSAVSNVTINTIGKNGQAALKIRVKNCDVSNLEFAPETNVNDLKVRKKDSVWYLVYTGTVNVSQTLKNVKLNYSVLGYERYHGSINISKVSLKPIASDYKVAIKTPKVYTVSDKAELSSISIPITFIGKRAAHKIVSLTVLENKGDASRFIEANGTDALKWKDGVKYSDIALLTKLGGKLKIVYENNVDITAPFNIVLDRKTSAPKISGVKIFGAIPVYLDAYDENMFRNGAVLQYVLPPEWNCIGITCENKNVKIKNGRLVYIGTIPNVPVDVNLVFQVQCNGVTTEVKHTISNFKSFYKR